MNDNPKDKSKFSKVSLVMEKFWLVIAIASLLGVFYFFIVDGVNRQTLTYLIFPALAGAMYAFRVTFRKRFERNND
ncbi:MAG TPA: hypothetical protein VJ949_11275 [Cryomorphaceae bacterium]|nr:hypothetical protein [Cryomorphaceae bacterium]